LQNTLVVAQQTADEVKSSARKEAELIVREAQAKADEILRQADAKVRATEEQLAGLRRDTDRFRAQVKSLLESQMMMLNEETAFKIAPEQKLAVR
ncbi:MAG: DivIVA domain-containing protein, partial [Firmicutes bacterium]|nr:DivIVA domain-containing protein [Bacillota bacterium]